MEEAVRSGAASNKAEANTQKQGDEGIVRFDCLTFDSPGVYEYLIKEKSPGGAGWTTDTRAYRMIITVTDDGQGRLLSSAAYPDGYPEFINTYNAEPANVLIRAVKIPVGKSLIGGEFEFGLFDAAGSFVAAARNGADGGVTFPVITFSREADEAYTIRELTPSGNGWTVGGESYPARVVVADNGEGRLIASVEYPNGAPQFTNVYKSGSVCVCPSACKRAVGAAMYSGQFEFGVYDINGNEISSGTNEAAPPSA
jgi:pilin isopeptide linkage protein